MTQSDGEDKEASATAEEPQPPETSKRAAGGRRRNQRTAKDDAAESKWAVRREECVRLRSSGYTWSQVAKRLGYCDPGNAYRDFKKAVLERPAEAVDEMRARSNEALDVVMSGHLEKARNGDARSADVVIKAIAQHARLNGYEAPQKHELAGKDGGPIVTSDARAELLAKLTGLATGVVATGAPSAGGGESQSN
jgi:hypothetical protein